MTSKVESGKDISCAGSTDERAEIGDAFEFRLRCVAAAEFPPISTFDQTSMPVA